MKRLIILSMLLFSVGTQSAVTAAEDGQVSGEVSATGKLTSVSGNKAKFNEYGDVKDGVYGDIRLKYDSEKYYTDFNSHDIGYDTQRYQIEGGKWGDFKFNLNYDEIPHNITEDAKTFYSGAGSHNLRYSTPPSRKASNWNTFDYSTKRKNPLRALNWTSSSHFFSMFPQPGKKKPELILWGWPEKIPVESP